MPTPPRPAPAPGTSDPLAPLLDLAGVQDALDAARAAVDRLLGHRVLRRQSAAVSSESALRGARASAALDGADVPLGDLRAGAVEDPVVQGALRVSAGLGGLVAAWEQAPLQVLARLHVLAAAGSVPPEDLGRPAGTPATGARLEPGRPAGAPAVGPRLEALAGLVVGGTTVPGMVLAAIVHGELLSLAPFGTADGVVARAASRLTLITRGVDPKAVGVPEVGHSDRAEDYRQALAGYATGAPDGVGGWLRHCAAAVELGAQEGLAVCEAVLRG